jgi:putative transposase
LKPVNRRELVRQVRQAYQLSEKRACGLMRITRWSNRYQSRRDPQTELRIRLRDLAGHADPVRLSKTDGAAAARRLAGKHQTRLPAVSGRSTAGEDQVKSAAQVRITLPEATFANQRWSMDFVSERLADGRWFRILTIVYQYTRECLCMHADGSQTGEKVAEQLDERACRARTIEADRVHDEFLARSRFASARGWSHPTPQPARRAYVCVA